MDDNQIENTKADKKIDPQGRAYSTGKRKSSVARVWIKAGTGIITVNGRKEEIYFVQLGEGGYLAKQVL